MYDLKSCPERRALPSAVVGLWSLLWERSEECLGECLVGTAASKVKAGAWDHEPDPSPADATRPAEAYTPVLPVVKVTPG